MTADDAREFARRALARVGMLNVQIAPNVEEGTYNPPTQNGRSESIDVLQTHSVVPNGAIDLYVQRRGDSAVFVRDSAVAGGRLLSDAQFKALERFRFNPAEKRQRNKQRALAFGATSLVVLAAA